MLDWWHTYLNEFPPNLWVGVEPPGRRVPIEPGLLIEKVLAFMERVLDMLETVLYVGPVDPHPEPLADPGDDVFKGGGQEPALGGPVPDVLLVQQRVEEVLVHLLGPDHAVPAGGPGAAPSIAAAGAQPVLGSADHPRQTPPEPPLDNPLTHRRRKPPPTPLCYVRTGYAPEPRTG